MGMEYIIWGLAAAGHAHFAFLVRPCGVRLSATGPQATPSLGGPSRILAREQAAERKPIKSGFPEKASERRSPACALHDRKAMCRPLQEACRFPKPRERREAFPRPAGLAGCHSLKPGG